LLNYKFVSSFFQVSRRVRSRATRPPSQRWRLVPPATTLTTSGSPALPFAPREAAGLRPNSARERRALRARMRNRREEGPVEVMALLQIQKDDENGPNEKHMIAYRRREQPAHTSRVLLEPIPTGSRKWQAPPNSISNSTQTPLTSETLCCKFFPGLPSSLSLSSLECSGGLGRPEKTVSSNAGATPRFVASVRARMPLFAHCSVVCDC
jgi:hypothetical protein